MCLCICFDSEELDKFMESQGASAPGILTLTTSLSKPFMRLDKYPTLLQELERHVEVLKKWNMSFFCVYILQYLSFSLSEPVSFQGFEEWSFACLCPHQEAHPDYSDILKATAAFKSLVVSLEESRHICLWVHLFKFRSPPNPPRKLDGNKLSFRKELILFFCFMLIFFPIVVMTFYKSGILKPKEPRYAEVKGLFPHDSSTFSVKIDAVTRMFLKDNFTGKSTNAPRFWDYLQVSLSLRYSWRVG